MGRATRAVWLAAGVLCIAGEGAARADDKQACVDAYVHGQERKSEKKLEEARRLLLVCASRTCPGFMQGECAKWLDAVDASMPTIVVDVRDGSGRAIAGARLLIDGRLREEHLEGKAVAVDPGERTIRLEFADRDPVEQRAVVREGEKLRTIALVAPSRPAAAVTAAPAAPIAPPNAAPVATQPTRHGPIGAYVAGLLGAGALASFAYFAISGVVMESHVKSTCAPHCPQSDVDTLRHKYLAADISLGAAAVATGFFLGFVLLGDEKKAPSAAPRPAVSGALLSLGRAY